MMRIIWQTDQLRDLRRLPSAAVWKVWASAGVQTLREGIDEPHDISWGRITVPTTPW